MAEQGLRRTGGTELNLESMGVNLPYSMQAEQSVLGAALLQADIIPELVELLRPEMFYARQNGQIFAEMVRLFTAGQLGGGGHLTMAGAQLKGVNQDEARRRIQNAVRAFRQEQAEKARSSAVQME